MKRTSMLSLSALVLNMSCGAPNKSASDVGSAFSAQSDGLSTKLKASCDVLSGKNKVSEAAVKLKFGLEFCSRDVGVYASDLKTGIYFHPESDPEGSSPPGQTFNITNRAQVWLNRSLLDLVAVLLDKMRNTELNKNLTAGQVLTEQNFENLINVKVALAAAPVIDIENMQASQKIRLTGSGMVEVDLTAEVVFALVDGKLAAVLTTEQVSPGSFLKDISAAFFVVPHASDIYVDSFMKIELFNVGYTSLLKRQINAILNASMGTAIKEIEALIGLETTKIPETPLQTALR